MNVCFTIIRIFCLWILVLIANAFTTFASETLLIGKILEDPQQYHLHVVTLKGTVSNFQAIAEPFLNDEGLKCYGAYTFTLDDGTGSFEVIVRGVCGKGKIVVSKPANGQNVSLDGLIQAPGHYSGEGLPPDGEDRTTTQAIATKVTITK